MKPAKKSAKGKPDAVPASNVVNIMDALKKSVAFELKAREAGQQDAIQLLDTKVTLDPHGAWNVELRVAEAEATSESTFSENDILRGVVPERVRKTMRRVQYPLAEKLVAPHWYFDCSDPLQPADL
jgi:hypothetical protein